MKISTLFVLLILGLSGLSCISFENFVVGNDMLFVGYGKADYRFSEQDRKEEAGKESASIHAKLRINEAINGKRFILQNGLPEPVIIGGNIPGYNYIRYRELAPDLYRSIVAVDISHVHFGDWGKTRRLSMEMPYPGDFRSVSAKDYWDFLRDVENATNKLVVDDAIAENFIKDDKLELRHIYTLHDIQDNGSVKITVIYAVPESAAE